MAKLKNRAGVEKHLHIGGGNVKDYIGGGSGKTYTPMSAYDLMANIGNKVTKIEKRNARKK